MEEWMIWVSAVYVLLWGLRSGLEKVLPELERIAHETEVGWDNRAVSWIGRILGWVGAALDFAQEYLPMPQLGRPATFSRMIDKAERRARKEHR